MSVTVSNFQTVELPQGTPLACVGQRGDVTLWPSGIGQGPSITMSVSDWHALKTAAEGALLVARNRLDGYSACEGNGDEL
jgi:hypothetical protein